MTYDTNKLRGKIKECQYTQREVADLIGVCPQTLSKKLNKKTPFELPEAIKLCEVLGTTLDAMFLPDRPDKSA